MSIWLAMESTMTIHQEWNPPWISNTQFTNGDSQLIVVLPLVNDTQVVNEGFMNLGFVLFTQSESESGKASVSME